VLFRNNFNFLIGFLELKKSNETLFHKLGANRATNKIGEFVGAHSDILLNLDYTKGIFTSFGLDRKYIMGSSFIYADIQFIGFYLSKMGNRSSEMILERVTSHACKNIYKSIVS